MIISFFLFLFLPERGFSQKCDNGRGKLGEPVTFCDALTKPPDFGPLRKTINLVIRNSTFTDLTGRLIRRLPFLRSVTFEDTPLSKIHKRAFISQPEKIIFLRNDFQAVPIHAFENRLQNITLAGQNISKISDRVGSEIGKKSPKLRKMNLRENLISIIEPNAFVNLGNLEILDLGANKLMKLDFHPAKVADLRLDNNEISHITEIFTENSQNIKRLILRSNKLLSIPVFNFQKIEFLDLRFNSIWNTPFEEQEFSQFANPDFENASFLIGQARIYCSCDEIWQEDVSKIGQLEIECRPEESRGWKKQLQISSFFKENCAESSADLSETTESPETTSSEFYGTLTFEESYLPVTASLEENTTFPESTSAPETDAVNFTMFPEFFIPADTTAFSDGIPVVLDSPLWRSGNDDFAETDYNFSGDDSSGDIEDSMRTDTMQNDVWFWDMIDGLQTLESSSEILEPIEVHLENETSASPRQTTKAVFEATKSYEATTNSPVTSNREPLTFLTTAFEPAEADAPTERTEFLENSAQITAQINLFDSQTSLELLNKTKALSQKSTTTTALTSTTSTSTTTSASTTTTTSRTLNAKRRRQLARRENQLKASVNRMNNKFKKQQQNKIKAVKESAKWKQNQIKKLDEAYQRSKNYANMAQRKLIFEDVKAERKFQALIKMLNTTTTTTTTTTTSTTTTTTTLTSTTISTTKSFLDMKHLIETLNRVALEDRLCLFFFAEVKNWFKNGGGRMTKSTFFKFLKRCQVYEYRSKIFEFFGGNLVLTDETTTEGPLTLPNSTPATTRRHFFTLKPRPFTPRTTRASRTTRKTFRTTQTSKEEFTTDLIVTTTPELRLPTKPQTNPNGVTTKPAVVQATIDETVTLDVSPEESTIKATTDWKFGNSPASTTKRPFLNNSTLPEEKRIIIILTISFVAIMLFGSIGVTMIRNMLCLESPAARQAREIREMEANEAAQATLFARRRRRGRSDAPPAYNDLFPADR